MPLPFEEFQGMGMLYLSRGASDPLLLQHLPNQNKSKWENKGGGGGGGGGSCSVGSEPNSVLDKRRSPSHCLPLSAAEIALAVRWRGKSLRRHHWGKMWAWNGGLGECCLGLLASQEQSILKLIMGDIEDDPSMGLNKLLQTWIGSPDIGLNPGFGEEIVVSLYRGCDRTEIFHFPFT